VVEAAGVVPPSISETAKWIQLDDAVYSISFVAFEPRAIDSLSIAALALVISFRPTVYPARAASRGAPASAFRYE